MEPHKSNMSSNSYSHSSPSHGGLTSLKKVFLLHGTLKILIESAKNLPNKDRFTKKIGDKMVANLGILERMSGNTSDPFVTVSLSHGNALVANTYVIKNCEEPIWNQHFCIPVAHNTTDIRFTVMDKDQFTPDEEIGVVFIPAESVFSGDKIEGSYTLLDGNGKECNPGAVLSLSVKYIPATPISGSIYSGVPDAYFPLKKGGTIKLYQDAHVPDSCLPDFKLDNGMNYKHGNCWRDIFDAIIQAKHIIYIAGWSVSHMISLVRDGGSDSRIILGDLLNQKAQEKVRVLLLVWDDLTSKSFHGHILQEGIMKTNDEALKHFFKHSSVHLHLCKRSAQHGQSILKQQKTPYIFTHHQKTVIVDEDAGNGKRKIVAFVGGLDLCQGRYDTPMHPLFETLQTVHKNDYYNGTFKKSDECGPRGPRQPWHDMHSKIDGPAAYDVLDNFEDRWKMGHKLLHFIHKTDDDLLLDVDNFSDVHAYLSDSHPEAWNVQVFRSIDSNSVKSFPNDPREACRKNLTCGKNIVIDSSIQKAYIHAIRAAQHFIYIENQYFIGSSFNWDSHQDRGANNLIPIEIALKIANKIKANERFAVYVVIPMWPEGNPTESLPYPSVQRILYWQRKTIQMMYRIIYEALKEAGLEDKYNPQDYLNFFCLGKRKADNLDRGMDGLTIHRSSSQKKEAISLESARKKRRFMIYVHSKGMIVDDEYLIIGSANINERSMDGSRDTEIAIGAYQPQYTWVTKQSSPHGQIYGYRMSLWAEHIGFTEDIFDRPESVECVRSVRAVGEANWRQFAADETTEMRGHLLKYPLIVSPKGKVGPIPNQETFPDVGGDICGSFMPIQEMFKMQENLTI